MEVENLDKALVAKALNYHGLQLQKIFETEYPNFGSLKLDNLLNFNDYSKRQKSLSFQDRGKRFRLQQFIGKHVDKLFTRNKISLGGITDPSSVSDYCPVMPPFEWFLNADKELRLQRFFEYIQLGDVIVASVMNKTAPGIILRVLYAECDNEIRCVLDIGIKAFCPTTALIPAVDKKTSTTRAFLLHDSVCCEVLEVNTDTEKIVCGMKGIRCLPQNQTRLGLISSDDFSPVFKKFQEKKRDQTYNQLLAKSENFFNANFINNQLTYLGLPDELYTHFKYLKEKFPMKECASELRQMQASKWSFRGVADGIEHFKAGRYTEAFQCLNKALTIDPKNIEALVARGALYANSSNYEKAISDFEIALKYNSNHQNAKKYLGDTLIAYGRTHEENNKFEDAAKIYESCLKFIPNHEEAKNSLQFINNMLQARKESDENSLDPKKIRDLCQLLSQGDDRTILRELKKLRKKKPNSNSSSSSSSDSSDSSNDSSSSSESSIPGKKKKKSKKESSLSPLSKRMALMDSNSVKEGFPTTLVQPVATYNPHLISYSQQGSSMLAAHENNGSHMYDMRFIKLLEESKKSDYHEEQVRKFLEETAKWRRQRTKEAKKKKKKERLKLKKKKKDSKRKKKKDEKKHHKKHSSGSGSEYLDTPFTEKQLNLNSLKDLEELQTKLSAYYSKVEKASGKSKKDSHKDKEERPTKHKIKEPEVVYEDDIPKRRSIEKSRHGTRESSYEGGKPPPGAGGGFKFSMQVSHRQNKVKKRDEEDPFWGDDKNITDEEMERNDTTKQSTKLSLPPGRHRSPVQRLNPRPSASLIGSDKHRGYSAKKDSHSPKRHSFRSKSRSKSLGRSSRYRSRSTSRRRYSRSRSRSRSYHRRGYTRYSRSRSYTRSRTRTRSRSRSRFRSRTNSPVYRDRVYRGRGTYYKPRSSTSRAPQFRASNWRYSSYTSRNRGFSPRGRSFPRRPSRPFNRSLDNIRDYRQRRSSDEITEWRDSSRERSVKRNSEERNDRDDTPLRFASTQVAKGEPSAPGTEPTD